MLGGELDLDTAHVGVGELVRDASRLRRRSSVVMVTRSAASDRILAVSGAVDAPPPLGTR